MGVGWARQYDAWSFPMRDVNGAVRGIRLRRPNGFKFAVVGSKEGLFLPELPEESTDPLLLISEGATDAAALLDFGFRGVVGRPSCAGGSKLLVSLVRQRLNSKIVIVADSDKPGQDGANRLASILIAYTAVVKVVTPPHGIKDARAWLRSGATRIDVEQAIGQAPERRLKVRASIQTKG